MDCSDVFYGVIGFLGKALIVIVAYLAGHWVGLRDKAKWYNYVAVLGVVALISLGLWATYGTHTEDADPLFGGGETVVDFEPSDKQRNEHGLTMFFVLSIPALYGVYRRQKEEPLNNQTELTAELKRPTEKK
jgi:hypothetical protein